MPEVEGPASLLSVLSLFALRVMTLNTNLFNLRTMSSDEAVKTKIRIVIVKKFLVLD